MDIAHTEIFGPVAPVFTFDTDAEAIALANDTPYGLASYFWTRDYSRAWRVSEQLEAGMIGLNDVAISGDSTPFGGIKESGVGREGSHYGLDDYLEIKYVAMGGSDDPASRVFLRAKSEMGVYHSDYAHSRGILAGIQRNTG